MDICSVCNGQFENVEAYCNHTCTTGFTPTQPEHLGSEFALISQTAIARGEKRQELEAEGKTPEEAQAIAAQVVAEENNVIK